MINSWRHDYGKIGIYFKVNIISFMKNHLVLFLNGKINFVVFINNMQLLSYLLGSSLLSIWVEFLINLCNSC